MVKLIAPAKVNIGLSIVGRRPDGYHWLESLFWPITLTDELWLTQADTNSFDTGWAIDAPIPSPLPLEKENLVCKAMDLLPLKAHIVLRKRIPIGGGLGGGSSDAGAVLRHFVAQGKITTNEAENIAVKLGADVPYFLNPKPCWVEQIGELRKHLLVESGLAHELSFLLVLFPFPTSTKAIFDEFRKIGNFSRPKVPPLKLGLDEIRNFAKVAKNDLEPFVLRRHPQIGEVLAILRDAPALYAGISGTGSTCFALYPDEALRAKSLQALSPIFRNYGCKSVKATTHRDG